MEIDEQALPGIGLRYGVRTRAGDRFAVVVRRGGEVEVSSYDANADPDAGRRVMLLDDDEAETLSSLLRVPKLVSALTGLDDVAGVTTARIRLDEGTPFAGRPLGETRARTRTGVSIVALLRAGEVEPSPGPDSVLQAGDVVVVVGTASGVGELREILRTGG